LGGKAYIVSENMRNDSFEVNSSPRLTVSAVKNWESGVREKCRKEKRGSSGFKGVCREIHLINFISFPDSDDDF
jgi:hypothetical protein